jgi:hypothetical protein
MLKRLWLVFCILWTALSLYGLDRLGHPPQMVNFVILLFPWVVGPVVLYTLRFIRRGHF